MFDRPRLIPCLLMDNGNLVKTKKFKNPNYLGDPINTVKIYNEKEVDELCILDITKKAKKIDFDFLKNITMEAFMPLSYGGGIVEIEQAKKLYHIGFEKLVFNTSLIEKPDLIREVSTYAGSQSVVASIDVKKNPWFGSKCFIDCGRKRINITPVSLAKQAEELGAGEIFLNSMDRDGMMEGYDLNLIREVALSVNIPVIACGGAGTIEDLKLAIEAGAHAAAAGSIFVYYGTRNAVLINYPDEDSLIQSGIFAGGR